MEKPTDSTATQDITLPQQQKRDEIPESELHHGLPTSPDMDDIYNNSEKLVLIDEEKIIHNAEGLDPEAWNERADVLIDDLDDSEGEMSDEVEAIELEDEENIIDSFGGDTQNDLEEDQVD